MFDWLKKRPNRPEPAEAIGALAAEAQRLEDRGDLEGALRVLEEAESRGRQLGEAGWPLLQRTLICQATIRHRSGDLVRAAALYLEATEAGPRLLDAPSLSLCWEGLADIHGRVDNLERALELHRRHRWDWRGDGNPSELCASLANRAAALAARGDRDGALGLFERVEQVCREWPSLPGLATVLGHQAGIHAARGDPGRALRLYREQEGLYRALGDAAGAARSQAAQWGDGVLGSVPGGDRTGQGAKALVELLGGRVEVDEGRTDRPVAAVNLRGCRVQDADLAVLQHLEGVRDLDLAETDIGDAGLAYLTRLPGLRMVSLQLTAVTDRGIEHLRGLTQLQALLLGGTRVTDACLTHLRGMPELEVLILGGTGVTDAGLAELRGIGRLRTLDLRDTQVTDVGLGHLKGLPGLRKVNLTRTPVTREGVEGLRADLPNAGEILI